jgi:hypothetical protein
MNDSADIVLTYRRFAELECKGYSEAYYRLALAVAEDADAINFLAAMPVIQPNLLFASIQFLTGPDRMPRPGPELRAFLRRYGGEVGGLMRSRRTQTNEVGRCAVLLPALPSGPLALVEVGASAGLCLLLDQFYYDFGSMRIGPASSRVHVRCALAALTPLPSALPRIVWRCGLDLRPVDVRDDDAVRWLLACVWPDHHERRERLWAAIELARMERPLVLAGDLLDDLPALLAGAPADGCLVVVHSAVLSYLTPERRAAFARVLAAASERRDIVWVSNEGAGVVPEIAALASSRRAGSFLLGRTRFVHGRRSDEFLAVAHPHGAELAWHTRARNEGEVSADPASARHARHDSV